MNEIQSTLLELLADLRSDIDFETETALIDNGLLSSLDIIQLISTINDEFDISIPATEIIARNFNSVAAMAAMVEKLQDL